MNRYIVFIEGVGIGVVVEALDPRAACDSAVIRALNAQLLEGQREAYVLNIKDQTFKRFRVTVETAPRVSIDPVPAWMQ